LTTGGIPPAPGSPAAVNPHEIVAFRLGAPASHAPVRKPSFVEIKKSLVAMQNAVYMSRVVHPFRQRSGRNHSRLNPGERI